MIVIIRFRVWPSKSNRCKRPVSSSSSTDRGDSNEYPVPIVVARRNIRKDQVDTYNEIFMQPVEV
nr:hypothetical protein [Veillonella sp.]